MALSQCAAVGPEDIAHTESAPRGIHSAGDNAPSSTRTTTWANGPLGRGPAPCPPPPP